MDIRQNTSNVFHTLIGVAGLLVMILGYGAIIYAIGGLVVQASALIGIDLLSWRLVTDYGYFGVGLGFVFFFLVIPFTVYLLAWTNLYSVWMKDIGAVVSGLRGKR